MAQQVGSRRSMIVSLILTIAIAFGSLVATLSLGWGPKLGLDLAGGLSVVYTPATHATNADMSEVVTILSNRVNGLGVSGATVNLQGKNVVVSVPGATDARHVLKIVDETAQLLFRPVICQVAEPTSKARRTRDRFQPAPAPTNGPRPTSRSRLTTRHRDSAVISCRSIRPIHW